MTHRPRHIMIYGPPAAGKLTVATALADRHDLCVLDNHLTFDVALRVFDFGTPRFNELIRDLREVLFTSVAAAGRDAVSTFVYAHGTDRPYVDRLLDVASASGVDMWFVQLCPPAHVLHDRVAAESRQTTNKIRDVATLDRVLDDHDLLTPIHSTDLRIDNAALPPDDVAARIAAHVGLTAAAAS